jgi:hypothetical protein
MEELEETIAYLLELGSPQITPLQTCPVILTPCQSSVTRCLIAPEGFVDSIALAMPP